MSLIVKAALLESRTLPKNEGRVLLAIAAHTNRAGDAWPSVATIAEYAGCSERTVQRCIPKLIKLGKLIVTKVAGIVTRVYRLVLGKGPEGVPTDGQGVPNQQPGAPDQPAGGDSQNGNVSPEVEGVGRKEAPPRVNGRLDWRRYVPGRQGSSSSRQRQQPHAERRGAALPPPPGGDRCEKPGHLGQLVGRCIPCRGEALAGSVR